MDTEVKKSSRGSSFVGYVISRCQQDNGLAAALRRADNPATEYQSWELLAGFNIDLEKPWQRLPFAAVGAAVARAKLEKNGSSGLGAALAACYDDGNNSDQAKAKLRRVLACDSVEECCRVLRPLFSLIDSKAKVTLDYGRLLDELLKFHWDPPVIKARWAQDFYRRTIEVQP